MYSLRILLVILVMCDIDPAFSLVKEYSVAYPYERRTFYLLAVPDNRGREFILGFMEPDYQEDGNVKLLVTTLKTTPVNVRVRAPKHSSSINETFTLTAGQVKQLLLPLNIRMSGTSFASNAILLTADDEVVVHGVNQGLFSTDAFLALPTDVIGNEYYVACWFDEKWFTDKSEILVVGTQNSTQVNITISQLVGEDYVTYNGENYHKGETIALTMNQFDTFQMKIYGDLTGSKVTSSKPVSVFSGNKRARIDNDNDIGAGEHLVEQWPPVDTWGKQFATVPIPERTVGDKLKFIGSENNTHVAIYGKNYSASFTVNAGRMVEKEIPSGNNFYCYIQADKPILVVQFCKDLARLKGPMMMMITPIELYETEHIFATFEAEKAYVKPTDWMYPLMSYTHYFMFVVKKHEKSGLRIDGSKFPSNTEYIDIPGTNPALVGGYMNVSNGSHIVRHTSPISNFGGYLYGVAYTETYGFPTGMRMNPINSNCTPTATQTGDGIDNDCDGLTDEELCTTENQRQDDDGDGKADEDCATPRPIHGRWGKWGNWGSCSVTCGTGTTTKSRSCDNPRPAHGGNTCSGPSTRRKSCSLSACPIYTGCYEDTSESILNSEMTTGNNMTLPECMQFCKKKYYAYAGVENGVQCFCGGHLGTHQTKPDTDCNMPCGGNGAEKCGGVSRISIFYIVDERWTNSTSC